MQIHILDRTFQVTFQVHRTLTLPSTRSQLSPSAQSGTSTTESSLSTPTKLFHGSWYQWMPTIIGRRVFQVVLLGQRGSMVE